MAKVAFNKLNLKIDNTVNNLQWNIPGTSEFIEVEVKYYLSIEEKIELITNIINLSVDSNGFYNPIKVKIFTTLEIMYHYTNINFTDKMKENPFKLYDLVVSTGLYEKVKHLISNDDYVIIMKTVEETIKNIYDYKNSVMGILDNVTDDYDNLNFDAAKIQKMIGDPENLGLLREVLDKLG
jgi:hypothetical protein